MIIGLDVGTSRVKAVLFDERGEEVDSSDEATTVLHGPGGRREQDLEEVWQAAARVLQTVAGRSASPIEAISITAQGDGTWLVDRDGEPCGPALLWNDSRATALNQARLDDGTLERAFRRSGSMGAPGLASVQIPWLRQHDPERLARAAKLLSCGSWIYRRLTDQQVMERSEAANPFGDPQGQWDDEVCDLLDLGEERRLLPPVVAGESAITPLTAWAGGELGIGANTPVVLAPYDVVTSAVGSGVARPGSAVAILGTTLCVAVASDNPHLDRRPSGMTLPVGPPDRHLLAFATLTGTEALDWTARLLGQSDAAAVVRLAATSESAPEDLPTCWPYLSPAGERAPFVDTAASGELRGLRLDHGPADVALAVLEGLTLAVADCLDAAAAVDRVHVCGGGARSDLWCQLIADASGVAVTRTAVAEVGAWGAALHAQVALGHHADLDAALANFDQPTREFTPTASRAGRLRERLDVLRSTRG